MNNSLIYKPFSRLIVENIHLLGIKTYLFIYFEDFLGEISLN
jgi:hypothetical protein